MLSLPQVRDRILEEAKEQAENEIKGNKRGFRTAKNQLHEFLHDGEDNAGAKSENSLQSKPIADLFPEATVMFADIVG